MIATSLHDLIAAAGNLSTRVAVGSQSANWGQLKDRSILDQRLDDLNGACVVLAILDQFLAVATLVELDGVARRVVLCPPDLSRENLAFIIECAEADAIVTEQSASHGMGSPARWITVSERNVTSQDAGVDKQTRSERANTEWVLLTSGTTGHPKLVLHSLASLAGAIKRCGNDPTHVVWSTFYDIRRYGGLQIFLRAALTGASLVLRSTQESIADFLARAGAEGATHISGTPSQWRHALMSGAARNINPEYVRLSGEIADQAILNHLRQQYPKAKIAHAFASTEAGVAFEVNDGMAGFPPGHLAQSPDVEMKVDGSTLRIRSQRTAHRYLNKDSQPIKDVDGFVDTGDALELRDGRYYFVGRRDGTVNVGGLKVHPEEVEAVLNRHPRVSISLVRNKASRIMGSLVVADIVLRTPEHEESHLIDLQSDILLFCRGKLAQHKVPIAINFVPALTVAGSGKLVRPVA
jgi:acyl-coenzyme A synthetase/AMP-(fatty) acid ligase